MEKSNNHRGIHIKLPKGMWFFSFLMLIFKFVPVQPKKSNKFAIRLPLDLLLLIYTLLTYSVVYVTEINTENEKKKQ